MKAADSSVPRITASFLASSTCAAMAGQGNSLRQFVQSHMTCHAVDHIRGGTTRFRPRVKNRIGMRLRTFTVNTCGKTRGVCVCVCVEYGRQKKRENQRRTASKKTQARSSLWFEVSSPSLYRSSFSPTLTVASDPLCSLTGLVEEEEAFPRGSGGQLSALERRSIRHQATQDALFGEGEEEEEEEEGGAPRRRKKRPPAVQSSSVQAAGRGAGKRFETLSQKVTSLSLSLSVCVCVCVCVSRYQAPPTAEAPPWSAGAGGSPRGAPV